MEKVLVAFFSAEGNTAKVAKTLAEAIGADLFEIKPAEPYTAEDINWKNPLSRCNREKLGKKVFLPPPRWRTLKITALYFWDSRSGTTPLPTSSAPS